MPAFIPTQSVAGGDFTSQVANPQQQTAILAANLSSILQLQIAALRTAATTMETQLPSPHFVQVSQQTAYRREPQIAHITSSLNLHSIHFRNLFGSIVAAQRALQDRSAELHNSIYAPISLLPLDILRIIFSYVLEDANSRSNRSRHLDGARAPLGLSQVCRRFRTVAYGQRSLWCSVHDGMHPELLDLFLDLTNESRLSITMQLDPAIPILSNPIPFFPSSKPNVLQLTRINQKEQSASILLNELSSTRSLQVRLYKPDTIYPAQPEGFTNFDFGPIHMEADPQARPVIPRLSPLVLQQQNLTFLEELELEYPGRNGEGVFVRTDITQDQYPNLRSLVMRNFILESRKSNSPALSFDYLPGALPTLRNLVLDGLPAYISPTKVVAMLEGCPALESVSFIRIRWSRTMSASDLGRELVVMPKLKEMSFVKTLPVRGLVQRLSLPVLKTLRLCYSNTILGAAEEILLRNAPSLQNLIVWNPCIGKEDTSDFVAYVAGLEHGPRGDQLDLYSFPVISSPFAPHFHLHTLVVSPRDFVGLVDSYRGTSMVATEQAAGERYMASPAFVTRFGSFLKRWTKSTPSVTGPALEWLILEAYPNDMTTELGSYTRKLKVCKPGAMTITMA